MRVLIHHAAERGSHTAHVDPEFAGRLRLLVRRREHGVHVSALGGVDALAELSVMGIPFKCEARPERGTRQNECWITTDATFLFEEEAPP